MNRSNLELKSDTKKFQNKIELKKSQNGDLLSRTSQRHLVNASFLKQYNKSYKNSSIISGLESSNFSSPNLFRIIDSKELNSTNAISSQVNLFLKNKPKVDDDFEVKKKEHNFFVKSQKSPSVFSSDT